MSAHGKSEAKLYIAPSKDEIPSSLYPLIQKSLRATLVDRASSSFCIAMSGGSLPSLLKGLPEFLEANKNSGIGIDPQWDKWHVILADERLVPSSHSDSNMKALKESLLDHVPIPPDQIYGIDESLLPSDNNSNSDGEAGDATSISSSVLIAREYQKRVFGGARRSSNDYLLDCVLLGFGPDGHTASLFPNHELLREDVLLVASIDNSPKPPKSRITLTMRALNERSRDIIFVGAGESKAPILKGIFHDVHYINNGTPLEKIISNVPSVGNGSTSSRGSTDAIASANDTNASTDITSIGTESTVLEKVMSNVPCLLSRGAAVVDDDVDTASSTNGDTNVKDNGDNNTSGNDNEISMPVQECVAFMKGELEIRHDFPCGLIRPRDGSLVYMTDIAGAMDLEVKDSPCSLL